MNPNPTSTNINMLNQEKPVYSLTVPVTWTPKEKRSFLNWLTRRPTPPAATEKTFTFTLSVVANMTRIAKVAMNLPQELFGNTAEEMLMDKIQECSKDMVYIIAAGIQNNRLEPDPELMTFIENNFDSKSLHEAFQITIAQLGLYYFMRSIVLISGSSSILKPKTDA